LRDRRRTFTAELAPDTIQDEFAIASILFDMEDYLAGGPSPYPLEEALEDAYFTLLSRQAQDNPFTAVFSERMPWHT
ncbi:MAG: gfo/Idh/MocA family oxidoreductase, partial [Clostridia bacterium]|nr:gfo/Idh/MocA family oxidoreductase [Clostridia bacterium]